MVTYQTYKKTVLEYRRIARYKQEGVIWHYSSNPPRRIGGFSHREGAFTVYW